VFVSFWGNPGASCNPPPGGVCPNTTQLHASDHAVSVYLVHAAGATPKAVTLHTIRPRTYDRVPVGERSTDPQAEWISQGSPGTPGSLPAACVWIP